MGVNTASYILKFPKYHSPLRHSWFWGQFWIIIHGFLSQLSLKTMLLPILTLSLEKEVIVLEKVWKKSWILHPKNLHEPWIQVNIFVSYNSNYHLIALHIDLPSFFCPPWLLRIRHSCFVWGLCSFSFPHHEGHEDLCEENIAPKFP